MNRSHLSKFSSALRGVLGDRHLTARARETGHCRRLRDVTPQRLVCALVEALGSSRVETIADLLRSFNALTGLNTQYKAFYNRLAKPEFPRFLEQVYRDLLRRLSQQVLRTVGGLSRFTDIVIQDGSSFAIHDALQEVFGGRFTKIRPAAVEVHTSVSLLQDQVLRAAVAPDKDGERAFLPAPNELRGKLLLHDRGYQDLSYWDEVQQAGGFFLGRGKTDLNPRLRRVRGPKGRLPRFEGRRLQEVLGRLPRRRVDLEGEWKRRFTGRDPVERLDVGAALSGPCVYAMSSPLALVDPRGESFADFFDFVSEEMISGAGDIGGLTDVAVQGALLGTEWFGRWLPAMAQMDPNRKGLDGLPLFEKTVAAIHLASGDAIAGMSEKWTKAAFGFVETVDWSAHSILETSLASVETTGRGVEQVGSALSSGYDKLLDSASWSGFALYDTTSAGARWLSAQFRGRFGKEVNAAAFVEHQTETPGAGIKSRGGSR